MVGDIFRVKMQEIINLFINIKKLLKTPTKKLAKTKYSSYLNGINKKEKKYEKVH